MHPSLLLGLLLPPAALAAPSDFTEGSALVAVRHPGCTSAKHWQGGSCKLDWRGICYDKCKEKQKVNNCCAGSLTSKIEGDNRILGASTCECWCDRAG
ncbi:hypothetical protein NKR19_g10095 [Coniochaeta hoffmannii]|uniref:Uncharacterized protein n=1 Tax=Coniochaeta hoffmannii TaxID=91930 RepID=A0AA38R5Z1_9PEZI|nr:hypothetical protein NKR19_g10095 [Coniochaeta hoffmannii]